MPINNPQSDKLPVKPVPFKITFEKWSGGLAPGYWRATNPQNVRTGNPIEFYETTYPHYASGVVNPLSLPGYLSPANGTFNAFGSASLISNNDVVFAPIEVNDGNIDSSIASLYMGNATQLLAGKLFGNTLVNSGAFPYTLPASSSFQDAVVYQLNGVKKWCFFYLNTTVGDMGTFDFTSPYATAFATAVLSSASGGLQLSNILNGATPNVSTRQIIAETADNGFMYIANGSQLYQFDGTTNGGSTGTLKSAITLPPSRQIVDMRDGRGKLWIAMLDRGTTITDVPGDRSAGIATWDRSPGTLSFDDYIPLYGVSDVYGLIMHNGVPHCFTTSLDTVIQLRAWDGYTFNIVCEVGGSGSQPATRKSVISLATGLLWLATNGKIYFYGKIVPDYQDGLYIVGDTSADSGSGGAIMKYNANRILLPYKASGSSKLSWWGMNEAGSAVNIGSFYTISKPTPKLSRLKGLTAYYIPISSGDAASNVNFDLYKNGSTTSLGTFTLNYASAVAGWVYYPLGGINFENINEVQLKVSWATGQPVTSSPQFSKFEIDGESYGKLK